MPKPPPDPIEEARTAALEVLRHNARKRKRFNGLPRTAGWGYPEPYTRDLLITLPGVLVSGDPDLVETWRNVLETLSRNQTPRGHVPSLAHDPGNRGASDTTPLFLAAVAIYREFSGEADFLSEAAERSLNWMFHQSPDDSLMIAQQPTSDWRDEQWFPGYGLYVNAIFHWALVQLGRSDEAGELRSLMNRLEIVGDRKDPHRHEGFVIPHLPYFAAWAYKTESCERFDLLGNSLAILTGIASRSRAGKMIRWVEDQCRAFRKKGELGVDLPPCLFPVITSRDSDWRDRYYRYNAPWHYHNGGVWPFVCGFFVAALVAAGDTGLAREKLAALAELVRPSRDRNLDFGFNEWVDPGDGHPHGQDWQTWSAAMYLYAAECLQQGETPYFERPRNW